MSISDFEEKSWRTDFVLNVEGKKLYVTKSILSLASPVFDGMFQSEFKESSSEELALPGKKVEDVKEFLRCIYPNTLGEITVKNALKLLPLLEEYQVFHLKERCEKALMDLARTETSTENLFQLLRATDVYNLKNLRQKCIALASGKTPGEIDEAKRACKPPTDSFIQILENKVTQLSKARKKLDIDIQKVTEELDVWKSYVAVDLMSDEPVFDKGLTWEGLQLVLLPSAAKEFTTSTERRMWNVPLTISTSVCIKRGSVYQSYYQLEEDYLQFNLKHTGAEIVYCQINARCHLVNKQQIGKNVLISFKTTFTSGAQERSKKIKLIEEIRRADAGFVSDGKIALMVHLYMSKPSVT